MKGIYSNQFSGDPTAMEGEGVTTRCDFIMMTVNRHFLCKNGVYKNSTAHNR